LAVVDHPPGERFGSADFGVGPVAGRLQWASAGAGWSEGAGRAGGSRRAGRPDGGGLGDRRWSVGFRATAYCGEDTPVARHCVCAGRSPSWMAPGGGRAPDRLGGVSACSAVRRRGRRMFRAAGQAGTTGARGRHRRRRGDIPAGAGALARPGVLGSGRCPGTASRGDTAGRIPPSLRGGVPCHRARRRPGRRADTRDPGGCREDALRERLWECCCWRCTGLAGKPMRLRRTGGPEHCFERSSAWSPARDCGRWGDKSPGRNRTYDRQIRNRP
jgi:hypothetical protein